MGKFLGHITNLTRAIKPLTLNTTKQEGHASAKENRIPVTSLLNSISLLKKQLTPILLNVFKIFKKEEISLNLFNEASIALIMQPNKDNKKRELWMNTTKLLYRTQGNRCSAKKCEVREQSTTQPQRIPVKIAGGT